MANTQTSANDGASAPTIPTHQKTGDDSEWEYEYSTTETETYYVTVDISKADFMTRPAPGLMNGRSGFNKEKRPRGGFPTAIGDDPLGTDGEVDNEDGEGAAHPDESFQPSNKGPTEDDGPHKLQILGLHSANPIIAYKGHLYEGQWAQNVGTELLMAVRDEDNPLPALRQMDGGIDLLAASATRISLTEKIIEPTNSNAQLSQQRVRFNDEDYEDQEDEHHDLIVPRPEPGAAQDRYQQGDFLAKLVALKKRKGETDEVPVIARGNEGSTGRETRKVQKDTGRGRVRSGGRGPEKWGARENGNPKGVPGAQSGTVRPKTRSRWTTVRRATGISRGKARAMGNRVEGLVSSTAMSEVDDAVGEKEGSRPTPRRWSDLKDQSSTMALDNGDEDDDMNMAKEPEVPLSEGARFLEVDSVDEMDIDD